MLKSSEFNSAVPKFTNGNYASNPIDPTNIEEPSAQDYVRGAEPLDTLPAQWWNWLCNQFTSRFNKLNTYVKNIFDELTGFLSLLNITPDGTESAITTGQLKNAFKEDYPAYINSKLELGTTYVKKTQKVNNHALSGDVTVTKSDVGLGNVPNVSTNDQTPTYTEASYLTALLSGEKLSIAFGKLAKAVSSLISHINNTSNPHNVTKAQIQLGDVVNTGDSATPVENGTTKFTTGGAYTLKKDLTDIAESLPTDAVLHYSFDEVPDYPDGTATYKKDNDFSTTSDWHFSTNVTATLIDNCIKLQSNGGSTRIFARNDIFTTNNLKGKIVIVKFTSTFPVVSVGFQPQANPYPWYFLSQVKQNGNEYTYIGVLPSDMSSGEPYIAFEASSTSANNAVTISVLYIGNGSYSTQIIDNANGEWNSVSQSGVAVQGISGKGLRFFKNNYVSSGTDFQFSENFSCSIWCKPEDFSSNCHVIRKLDVITLLITSGTLSIYLDDSNHNALLSSYQLSGLTINRFTHIVIVRSGLQFKYYKNGVLTKTVNLANSTIAKNNSPLTIGSELTVVNHIEDDLLIFNRALSETEVMALYLNKANTPKYFLGNSDLPIPNGNVPFTTGGAYNLLVNLAPTFSTSTAYPVNQLVTYNGTLYKCTTTHSAGAWNNSHFTAVTLNDVAGVTGVKGNSETEYRKGNVNITKNNIGLSNVVNTGDSATPVENGTTKFTTGGAYTELNKKFDKLSAGDQVTYSLSGNTLTITSM